LTFCLWSVECIGEMGWHFMNKAKYIAVAERLEQRVRQGDYLVQPIPSERRLASEV